MKCARLVLWSGLRTGSAALMSVATLTASASCGAYSRIEGVAERLVRVLPPALR
jgi:hypothetical protein